MRGLPISFPPALFPTGGNRLQEGSPQLTEEVILEENPLAEVSMGEGNGLRFNLIPLFKGRVGRTWNRAQGQMLLYNPPIYHIPKAFLSRAWVPMLFLPFQNFLKPLLDFVPLPPSRIPLFLSPDNQLQSTPRALCPQCSLQLVIGFSVT